MKKAVFVLWLILIICLSVPQHVALAETDVNVERKVKSVTDYFEQAIDTLDIPGAALGIVYDGQLVQAQAWGVTGEEKHEVTTDTPFLIGSNSKALTAYGMLKLVQEGKVDLESPVQEYIPWFRVEDEQVASEMTIKQLISHTSGLSSDSGFLISDQGIQGKDSIQNIVHDLAEEQVSFKPGEDYEYSAANYAVLGAVVESVTGLTFAEYMKQEVFLPLGMEQTAAESDLAHENGWDSGYQTWFGIPVASTIPYDNSGATYGYMSASVKDMTNWLSALQKKSGVLNDSFTELSLQPIVETSLEQYYGYGWRITRLEDGSTNIWHAGSTADFRSEVFMLPESRWGIVLLTNRAHVLEASKLSEVSNGILSILSGEEPQLPTRSTQNELWIITGFNVLVLSFLLWTIKGLRKHRVFNAKRRLMWAGVGLINILLAVLFFPLFLTIFGVNLRILMLYAPDLTWLILILITILFASGVLSILRLFKLKAVE